MRFKNALVLGKKKKKKASQNEYILGNSHK